MSNVKFTKTATFIFPLLEVPKSLFECSIRDVFDRVRLVFGTMGTGASLKAI
jgi:hypothetical protein